MESWLEIGSAMYGAKPDRRRPIGGGKGFSSVIAKGDHTVYGRKPKEAK